MKPPQSYLFRSILWAIPISVTNSPRVRTKITPYDTHQPTLMSPRYSNVTTSIRELIIRYASNNFRFIIFNPHKELQRVPQSFYRRKEDENVYQPICLDSPRSWESASWLPKHTSSDSIEYPIVTTGIPCKTYIKCSQIQSIQSDNNETSKGKIQFITRR